LEDKTIALKILLKAGADPKDIPKSKSKFLEKSFVQELFREAISENDPIALQNLLNNYSKFQKSSEKIQEISQDQKLPEIDVFIKSLDISDKKSPEINNILNKAIIKELIQQFNDQLEQRPVFNTTATKSKYTESKSIDDIPLSNLFKATPDETPKGNFNNRKTSRLSPF
jgi:hydroxymethylpyrimidine pyrophosphatase-like HAD family hydrolase